jgi:hypothetical protein
MIDDCPSCFQGVQLRKGIKYQNLNRHYFTFVEKYGFAIKLGVIVAMDLKR